jgi:hypothetical protein
MPQPRIRGEQIKARLKKRTSINSKKFRIYKEKEMAEFRKLFYALGLASLLVGVSSTAQAAVQCTGTVANPPIIREESFTELVGDIILDCTGGTSTTAGNAIQPINITLSVSAPVTSRLLDIVTDTASGVFNEALLIIDEPNSPASLGGEIAHIARPLLACGDNETTVSTPTAPYLANAPGVCTVLAPPAGVLPGQGPSYTYDGTTGRPNVFQGRVVTSNSYQIAFNGVPFDPPGPIADGEPELRHRILRFTNIRVVSPSAASPGQQLSTVSVEININGTDITLTNRQFQVASVSKGINPQSGVVENSNFLQCQSYSGVALSPVVFREGFPSSFKVRGWGEIERNGEQTNGVNQPWLVDLDSGNGIGQGYVGGGGSTYGYSTPQLRQNLPGGLYFTESGFTSNGDGNPNTYINPAVNAPIGTGPAQNLTGGVGIWNTTNVSNAGIAMMGTRIILTFKDIPAGTTLSAPDFVYLYRAGTSDNANRTGVAMRTYGNDQSARGDGAFTAVPTGSVASTGNRVVYEILFSRSQIIEDIRIVLTVSSTPNLASDQPEVNKYALVTGGFAPFQQSGDNFSVAARGSVTTVAGLPIPRFVTQSGDQKLYSFIKCSCNLLFPFTTNATTTQGNFDTGIAIANTSKLPNANGFVQGTSQQGGVQFWYFQSRAADPAVATQCANKTTQPSPTNSGCDNNRSQVLAGETLTYILSQNDVGPNARWGLDNRAKGFTGYIVAQTGFQYCHAFAYISPEGAFPLTNGMSVGYLALILDKEKESSDNQLPARTTMLGESLTH